MTTRLVSYFAIVYAVWRLLSEFIVIFIESLNAAAPTILISVAVMAVAAAKMGDKAAQWLSEQLDEKQKLLLSLYASLGAAAIALLMVGLRSLIDPNASAFLHNLYGLGLTQPWTYALVILLQAALIRLVFGFFYTATLKDFGEG